MNVKCLKCGSPIASSGPHICKRDPAEMVKEAEAFAAANVIEMAHENLRWASTGGLPNGKMRDLIEMCSKISKRDGANMAKGMAMTFALKYIAQPWPIRGVRVDDDKVIIAAKDNDAARWVCGELVGKVDQPKESA